MGAASPSARPPAPGAPDAATECLDDGLVADLVEGRLDAASQQRVQRHLAGCSGCLELVGAVVGTAAETATPAEDALAPTALGEESAASEPASRPAGPGVDRGWTPPGTFDEFRLLRPLGRGAMGMVFLALDTLLARHVAIKFVTGITDFATQRARFLQEARAVARFTHPNVVMLYRVGEVSGRPYLVSEYVAGTPLDALPRPLPPAEVLAAGIDLARGLAAAHRQGVLHRDIKPANAIRTHDGTVKLLDFGLAKLGAADAIAASLSAASGATPPEGALPGLTATGTLLGTPRYLAPEGWRREPATPQRDVFAVGALLYELAAGRPAYQASSLEELRHKMLAAPPAPLGTVAPTLDRELAAVVDSCLAADPAQRPADGTALLAALGKLHPTGPGPLGARRRLGPTGLMAGAVFLLLVVTGAWQLLRARGPSGSVLLSGGTFIMGSKPEEIDAAFYYCQRIEKREPCVRAFFEREQPLRTVTLSPFRLDATEVTNSRFAAWLNRLPSLHVVYDEAHNTRWIYADATPLVNLYPSLPTYGLQREPDGHFVPVAGYGDRPVTQVTWLAAHDYCQAHGQRLPTEAEWEYAARPHPDARFPWGVDPPRCDGVVFARLPGQECAGRGMKPDPVGHAAQDRTPQGVYDLAGNAAEWVADQFSERYPPCAGSCLDPAVSRAAESPAADPTRSPVLRVFRGGDWAQVAATLRSAGRSRWRQDEALQNVGFRCASSAASSSRR